VVGAVLSGARSWLGGHWVVACFQLFKRARSGPQVASRSPSIAVSGTRTTAGPVNDVCPRMLATAGDQRPGWTPTYSLRPWAAQTANESAEPFGGRPIAVPFPARRLVHLMKMIGASESSSGKTPLSVTRTVTIGRPAPLEPSGVEGAPPPSCSPPPGRYLQLDKTK